VQKKREQHLAALSVALRHVLGLLLEQEWYEQQPVANSEQAQYADDVPDDLFPVAHCATSKTVALRAAHRLIARSMAPPEVLQCGPVNTLPPTTATGTHAPAYFRTQ
jgi:hypothetical protein